MRCHLGAGEQRPAIGHADNDLERALEAVEDPRAIGRRLAEVRAAGSAALASVNAHEVLEHVAREVAIDLERINGQVRHVVDRIRDRFAQVDAMQVQLEPLGELAADRTVEIVSRAAERDGLERLVVGDERRDLGLVRAQAWPSFAFSQGS